MCAISKIARLSIKSVPLIWWNLCTLYLLASQVRVSVGDLGLCCCVFWMLINSRCLLMLHRHCRPHSVSGYTWIYTKFSKSGLQREVVPMVVGSFVWKHIGKGFDLSAMVNFHDKLVQVILGSMNPLYFCDQQKLIDWRMLPGALEETGAL